MANKINKVDLNTPQYALPKTYDARHAVLQVIGILEGLRAQIQNIIDTDIVKTIGEVSGDITLGEGIRMEGNQLTVQLFTDIVKSIGTQKGVITLSDKWYYIGQQLNLYTGTDSLGGKEGELTVDDEDITVSEGNQISISSEFKSEYTNSTWLAEQITTALSTPI